MLKGKMGRKLSRKMGQRKALLTSLMRELFKIGRIETTEAKAKETARIAEKIITQVKTKSLGGRRELYFLSPKETKIFVEKNGASFEKRKGGYTRVIKLGARERDGARMALLELVK